MGNVAVIYGTGVWTLKATTAPTTTPLAGPVPGNGVYAVPFTLCTIDLIPNRLKGTFPSGSQTDFIVIQDVNGTDVYKESPVATTTMEHAPRHKEKWQGAPAVSGGNSGITVTQFDGGSSNDTELQIFL